MDHNLQCYWNETLAGGILEHSGLILYHLLDYLFSVYLCMMSGVSIHFISFHGRFMVVSSSGGAA